MGKGTQEVSGEWDMFLDCGGGGGTMGIQICKNSSKCTHVYILWYINYASIKVIESY